MSIIEESLREEEKLGGFDPGADENSFILNEKSYDGDIPDFSQEVEELNDDLIEDATKEEHATEEEIDEAELIDTPESGSIWDQFDSEESEQVAEKTEELEEEESLPASEKEPEEEEETLTSESEEELEEEETSAKSELEEEERQPSTEGELEEEERQPSTEGELEEEERHPSTEGELEKEEEEESEAPEDEMSDEDLKSFLTEELERSKKLKEERASKEKPEEAKEDPVKTAGQATDFEPVDESDDAIEIDLSSFDIDSYSKKQSEKEKKEESKGGKKAVPPPPPTKKKKKPQKEKKERKKIPAWLPITLAAAIFLMALTIGGYYLYEHNKIFGIFSTEQTIAEDDAAEEKKSEMATKDTLAKEEEITDQEEDNAEEETLDDPEMEEDTQITEEESEEEISREEDISDARRPLSRKDQDFRSLPRVKKPSEKQDTKYDNPGIVTNTKQLPFSLDEEERGVYTVQVYSTLSQEDALDWLKKLKQKNIASAFISTQKIRDKVWYRVRFGAYQTKQDAKKAAVQYGFAQTWIDRVK